VKILTVDVSKCSGCRLCEAACSFRKVGEFNPARSRIHVIGFNELFSLPVMCFHCDKPYCMEVCPAGAITKDKATGIVRISKEKCTGCKMCTLACPFGNIAFSSEEKIAVKCDLCDGEPECVAICPPRALSFEEADTAMMYKQRALTAKLKEAYEGVR